MKPLYSMVCAVILICICSQGWAQERGAKETGKLDAAKNATQQKQKNQSKRTPPKKRQQESLSKQSKKIVFAFIKEHHPDLILLLKWLEKNRPQKHVAALRSLERDYKRLKTIKERTPKRYAFQLDQWKLKSRIQLYSVKLAISDTPKVREILKALIVEQLDSRVEMLESEQNKANARLIRANEQLKLAKDARENKVDALVNAAIQKAKRSKDRLKGANNKSKKKKSDGS